MLVLIGGFSTRFVAYLIGAISTVWSNDIVFFAGFAMIAIPWLYLGNKIHQLAKRHTNSLWGNGIIIIVNMFSGILAFVVIFYVLKMLFEAGDTPNTSITAQQQMLLWIVFIFTLAFLTILLLRPLVDDSRIPSTTESQLFKQLDSLVRNKSAPLKTRFFVQ